jgi:hypothetical protein
MNSESIIGFLCIVLALPFCVFLAILITPKTKNIIEDKEFYYCQLQIEQDKWCKNQCDHCKTYYKPLEQERKKEKGL